MDVNLYDPDYIKSICTYTEQGIPKIIHQIWINEDGREFPKHWEISPIEWRKLHPDYIYILWEKESSRKFVQIFFPEYLEMYDNLKYVIQRCDMIRFMFLYKMGGIYSDLDNYPTENLEKYMTENKDLYFVEMNNLFIKNSIDINLIFAKPENDIFIGILKYAQNCVKNTNNFQIKLKHVASTSCLDYINLEIKNNKKIGILPYERFNAYSLIDDYSIVKKNISIRTVKGGSWHGNDIKILLFIYKYLHVIILIIFLIIIIFIIVWIILKNNSKKNILKNKIKI